MSTASKSTEDHLIIERRRYVEKASQKLARENVSCSYYLGKKKFLNLVPGIFS
jgi:hypothetical protein